MDIHGYLVIALHAKLSTCTQLTENNIMVCKNTTSLPLAISVCTSAQVSSCAIVFRYSALLGTVYFINYYTEGTIGFIARTQEKKKVLEWLL